MSLKLYLIKRTDDFGYDQYDSAVVVSDSLEHARMIQPGGDALARPFVTWVFPKHVEAQYIGEADASLEINSVVCASYNAG